MKKAATISTVAELVGELPERFPLGKLKFQLSPGKEPVEVSRADLQAFINAVRLAAQGLYRKEPILSASKPRNSRRAKAVLSAVALLAIASGARADIIAQTGFVNPTEWDAQWVGTYTGIPLQTEPTGQQTISVAQLFDTQATYADLTMEIQLSGIDGGEIDFTLAAAAGSAPGAPVTFERVTVAPSTDPSLYTVSFADAVIGPGTYWLIASSPSVEPFVDQVQLPDVVMAYPCSQVPDPQEQTCSEELNDNVVAYDNNGAPWHLDSGMSFAYELDGIDPVSIPEPRAGIALVLVFGFLGCAAYRVSRFPRRYRRRDLSGVRANEALAPCAPDSVGWREAS
jgi:hypothetical protein